MLPVQEWLSELEQSSFSEGCEDGEEVVGRMVLGIGVVIWVEMFRLGNNIQ